MKKSICLFLFLVSCSMMPTLAQLKVGLTAGLNISQLHVSESDFDSYVDQIRPGFFVGPTAIYTLPGIGLGFDVSALYDMRGARSKDNDKCETIYCYSFQLPVNVRYGIDFGDMVHAFVFTGPQFGVSVGEKERLIISGHSKSTGHALERRWASESSLFSWNFGVGGVILEKVQVRVSYNLALKKSGEIRQVDTVDGTSIVLTEGKAHACQVSLSYLF